MDEEGLRDLLSKRLYIELQLFKDSMLQKEREEIFQSSYEIEVYVDLHEIFMAQIANLDSGAMRRLLKLGAGILEHAYWGWLDKEDSFLEELWGHACSELESLSKESPDCGEEGEDGTGSDKAAQGGRDRVPDSHGQ